MTALFRHPVTQHSPTTIEITMPPHDANVSPSATTALETAAVFLFYPEKQNRGAFLDNLRACGIKNHTLADKPQDAINLLLTRHYDVILACYLGNMEAMEQFIDELKGLDTLSGIPVLAITADGSAKNVLRIMSRAVDRVLVMPLSRKSMQDSLKGFLWSDPDDTTRTTLQTALDYRQAGQWEQAEMEYQGILKYNPSRVEALMGMAAVSLQKRQNTAAVDYLKQAMKAAKQLTDVVEQTRLLALIYAMLGGHFTALGAQEQAIKHYRTALKLNPFSVDILSQLIPVMAKAGSLDEILTYLDELSANYPPYSAFRDRVSQVLEELVTRYALLNMDDNVDRIHVHLAGLQHGNVPLHLKTVDHLSQRGRHTTVKILLETLLGRIKDSDLMLRLADLYRDDLQPAEKPAVATTVDRDYLREHPPEHWLRQSLALYKSALLLDPFELSIWLKLLRCHLRLGETDAASQLVERLFANLTIGLDEHADTCAVLLDEKAGLLARPWVEAGLKKYPLASRFHLLASQMHNAEGNHYEAITALKTGLREQPDSVECLTELGKSYGLVKNWSQAIEVYEKALKLAPADAPLQHLLQTALRAKYRSQA